jgi:hypothetical protein
MLAGKDFASVADMTEKPRGLFRTFAGIRLVADSPESVTAHLGR